MKRDFLERPLNMQDITEKKNANDFCCLVKVT